MKLTPDELRQLLVSWDGKSPVSDLIGDACEILTAKIVLRINAKRSSLANEFERLPANTHARVGVAAAINELGKLIVEIAETP